MALYQLAAGNLSNVKGVGGGVLERKIDFGPGYRICFGKDGDMIVILLGGSTKQRQRDAIAAAKMRCAQCCVVGSFVFPRAIRGEFLWGSAAVPVAALRVPRSDLIGLVEKLAAGKSFCLDLFASPFPLAILREIGGHHRLLFGATPNDAGEDARARDSENCIAFLEFLCGQTILRSRFWSSRRSQ